MPKVYEENRAERRRLKALEEKKPLIGIRYVAIMDRTSRRKRDQEVATSVIAKMKKEGKSENEIETAIQIMKKGGIKLKAEKALQ